MPTIIEIYPTCERPKWIKRGAKCHCLGEANDILKIRHVGKNAAFMMEEDGKTAHGWESFTKLYPVGGAPDDTAKEI